MIIRNISWDVQVAVAKDSQVCHIFVPIFLKSGNFHLLEHSGSLQACTGYALVLSLAHCKHRLHIQSVDVLQSHKLCCFWERYAMHKYSYIL